MIEQLHLKLATLELHRDALRQLLGKFDETLAALDDAKPHYLTNLKNAHVIVYETLMKFGEISRDVAAQLEKIKK